MAKATTNKETKVVTGPVRLSYAHVFQPYAVRVDDEPKYSVVLMIPKGDKKTMRALRAAEKAAAEAGAAKFGGKVPKNLASVIHDGDEEADLETNPEYEGHYYMSVSSKTRPGLFDKDVDPITDSEEIYSGCYCRASINAFAYNSHGNKGVSFGLNHLQKIKDGDFLGGRSKGEDDFDAWDEDDDEDDEDDGLI